ncbi:MAG: cobalamin biosynthesis protein [Coleofasciculaceae cyanobacterium]
MRLVIAPTDNVAKSKIEERKWQSGVLWVGIGCQRGTSKQLIEEAIWAVCRRYDLTEKIAGIATIDRKANEAGLVAFCQAHQLPLKTFPAEVLRLVIVPNPAIFVEQSVATPSVAEAAAIMADHGILRVSKQIFRKENQPGSVTVAIAQS